MAERTIKILLFRWVDEEGYDRYARKGDTVELAAKDAARGDADGAFVTEEDAAPDQPTIGPDSTDAELSSWVSDATVPEVVDAAGGDPAFAERLLLAENDATGNDPRKGVAEGLAAVAGQGDRGTPPESTPPAEPETPPAPADHADKPKPFDYSGWKGPELNAELEKRGIEFKPVGEKNSAKAEKLAADDKAKAAA